MKKIITKKEEQYFCDICGEELFGRSRKISVEGAVLDVCERCAPLGKPYTPPTRATASRPSFRTQQPRVARSSSPRIARVTTLPKSYEELELVDGFGKKIREARERSGMTQAELGTRVKERLSILQKIELEKMKPNTDLCASLEHVLRITLLSPRKEIPITTVKADKVDGLTLGDIVKLKRKK